MTSQEAGIAVHPETYLNKKQLFNPHNKQFLKKTSQDVIFSIKTQVKGDN